MTLNPYYIMYDKMFYLLNILIKTNLYLNIIKENYIYQLFNQLYFILP